MKIRKHIFKIKRLCCIYFIYFKLHAAATVVVIAKQYFQSNVIKLQHTFKRHLKANIATSNAYFQAAVIKTIWRSSSQKSLAKIEHTPK